MARYGEATGQSQLGLMQRLFGGEHPRHKLKTQNNRKLEPAASHKPIL